MIDLVSMASGEGPERPATREALHGHVGTTYRISEDGLLLDARTAREAEPGPGARLIIGRSIWELAPAHVAVAIMSTVRRVSGSGEEESARWPAVSGNGRSTIARFSRGGSGEVQIVLEPTGRIS